MNAKIQTTPEPLQLEITRHDALLTSIGADLSRLAKGMTDLSDLHITDREEALGEALRQCDHVRERLLSALDSAAELAGVVS